MAHPPDYLMSALYSIEQEVIKMAEEFESLNDKDVEWVYEQLKGYFKEVAAGKSPEEPLSTFDRRQALIDEILNILDDREELGIDDDYINNPEYMAGDHLIPSRAVLYRMAFKRLQSSVRLWRKELGPRGYITFISSQL